MNRPKTTYTRCYCGKDECETKANPDYAHCEVDCNGAQTRKDMWFTIRFFIVVSILIFVLLGCSAGGGDDASCRDIAHEYGYDVVGETGLMLVATTPEVAFISFEEMEAEYRDVEACAANTSTPGPTVFFTSFNHLGVKLELAFYSYASQSVYIDTDDEEWLPVRNCISDREFLRHEFMHHILYMNGEDPGHSNPKFDMCNARGPKSCNGEYCE